MSVNTFSKQTEFDLRLVQVGSYNMNGLLNMVTTVILNISPKSKNKISNKTIWVHHTKWVSPQKFPANEYNG